jgi:hypothetical protein
VVRKTIDHEFPFDQQDHGKVISGIIMRDVTLFSNLGENVLKNVLFVKRVS